MTPLFKRRTSPDDRVRVVIADDQPEVRRSLTRILESDARFELVAEAIDGENAIEVVEAARPDVLVLDLAMPLMDGLHALKKISALSPDTKVVILSSMVPFGDTAEQALQEGAHAVFSKYTKPKTLLATMFDLARPSPQSAAARKEADEST